MTSSSTDTREIQKFGTIALLFFGSLCALGLWRQKPFAAYLFGFLSVLGLGFIVLPSPLRSVYELWLKIAHFIGTIVTAIILALTYYMVITPAALLKRVFGGRPISIKPDKEVSSYWVSRTEPAQPKERFIKRY